MPRPYTSVETISQDEYLKLIGLHTLAAYHRKSLHDIQQAAQSITGETEDGGHTDEFIWSDNPGIDALLKRLNITVAPSVQNGA